MTKKSSDAKQNAPQRSGETSHSREKVTLRIIAERTGLSKFAVSRALSGKDGVSDATRSLVIQAAEQLGYERKRPIQTPVLAAVFDGREHVNGELHSQVQTGLQTEAANLGYSITAHWMDRTEDLQPVLDRARGVFAINLQDDEALLRIRDSGKPFVRNGWLDPLAQEDTVGGTDHEAGAAVARHLIGLGHREIVYVHGPTMLRGRRERLYGLREVVELNPGATFHDLVWAESESFSEMLTMLLESGKRPTAFFCAHDGLALTAITDMLARGWRIPEDVSVVGFGDFSPAQQIRPPLTTVKVPGYEIGRAAVRILHARLTDPVWPGPPIRLMSLNRLIERESTGPAAVR